MSAFTKGRLQSPAHRSGASPRSSAGLVLGAWENAALTPVLRVLQVWTEAFVLPGAQGTDRQVTSHAVGVTPAVCGTRAPQSVGLPQLLRGKRGNPTPSLSCGRWLGCQRVRRRRPSRPCFLRQQHACDAKPPRQPPLWQCQYRARSTVSPPQQCAPLPWNRRDRLQAVLTWLRKILNFETALCGAAGLMGLFCSRVQGAKRASPLPSCSPSAVYFSVSLGKRPLVAGRDV